MPWRPWRFCCLAIFHLPLQIFVRKNTRKFSLWGGCGLKAAEPPGKIFPAWVCLLIGHPPPARHRRRSGRRASAAAAALLGAAGEGASHMGLQLFAGRPSPWRGELARAVGPPLPPRAPFAAHGRHRRAHSPLPSIERVRRGKSLLVLLVLLLLEERKQQQSNANEFRCSWRSSGTVAISTSCGVAVAVAVALERALLMLFLAFQRFLNDFKGTSYAHVRAAAAQARGPFRPLG